MIELVGGVAIGVIGMIAKDKLIGNGKEQKLEAMQRELNTVYQENEKFRRRNKEMERQIEDLLAENQKVRKQFKDKDDDQDDLADELQKAKNGKQRNCACKMMTFIKRYRNIKPPAKRMKLKLQH